MIVELTHGCNHITCRCKTEFCFKCGGKIVIVQCRVRNPERWLICYFQRYGTCNLIAVQEYRRATFGTSSCCLKSESACAKKNENKVVPWARRREQS